MKAYPPPGVIGPRLLARAVLPALASVRVHGAEHVPRTGPVLIAALHYHHLLDGAVLLARAPRPVHIVVALDWTRDQAQRRVMERLCALAQWPVILRPAAMAGTGAYAQTDLLRYVRGGVRDAVTLLRSGRVVVVFPEGYPVIDPAGEADGRPPSDPAGVRPFARGFRSIALRAQREGAHVPIVPLGFAYARAGKRWEITARFGAPLSAEHEVADIQRIVLALSRADVVSSR